MVCDRGALLVHYIHLSVVRQPARRGNRHSAGGEGTEGGVEKRQSFLFEELYFQRCSPSGLPVSHTVRFTLIVLFAQAKYTLFYCER